MTRLPSEGEAFGRYQLRRVLGAGGMGMVFAAHDPALDREVALKLVVPHLAGDPEFRARFQHEAEVLARLDSARIVQIFDHGEHDGTLFLVTQLVAGGDLSKLIQRDGPLSPALAIRVLEQVLEGLGDAHAVGVVHRDIKPANVLLRERGRELEAFLCDFGIATTPGADLSRTGSVAGSLPYMAPERHQGEEAGPQGDVYAAGCLLWHTLTGSAPYAGTDVEVAVAHLQAPIPQLPGRDEFSRRMNAVIAKAMAKEPRRRYSSAKAMLTELRALAPIAPGAIALPGSTAIRQPVKVGVRRRGWRPAALAVAGVLVVTGMASAAALTRGDRQTAAPLPGPERTLFATETVRARDLGPSQTLSPRAEKSTQADGDVIVVPAEPELTEPPPAKVERSRATRRPKPQPGGGVTSVAPKPPTTTSSPSPIPTPTPTPTPTYKYRCWDGTRVYAYASCTWPTGAAGAQWVFRKSSRCGGFARLPSGALEGRICSIPHANGNKTIVTFIRWKSIEAARSHYSGWFAAGHRNRTSWNVGGESAGARLSGRAGNNLQRFRSVRYYDVSGTRPWSFAVNSDSATHRTNAVEEFRGARRPTRFRGVPL